MEGKGCALVRCTQGVLSQASSKGAVLPVVPLCPAPKPNAPVVELLRGAATFIPKPPLPAGPADTPNVKGNKVVLPNTELLVPLLVVWVVIAPKPDVVAAPKEEIAVVPKAS